MNSLPPETQISELFQSLSPLPRVQILQAIGEGEACVCHLETALGLRQAYLSQHLMALRQAGVVVSRREGRNVFYRLADRDLLGLIQQAGRLLGLADAALQATDATHSLPACPCPHCGEKETAFTWPA
ncbi:MAG: helix-turn-helix transcriptional regulator [Anaerolineales bacterium]|jgi:DNA-binding transcriptional ArsR family regulator|nr:helix-turn-helix transcriptional regulator [Anaerolineales bacterium]